MNQDARPVALVTGGAVRVGRAISEGLGGAGFAVAVNYHRSEAAALALVRQLQADGIPAVALEVDITQPGAAVGLLDAAEEALGPVRVLVNNAAVFERRAFLQLDEEVWRRHLSLNLEAPLWLGLEAGRRMLQRDGGRIVNICGTVGIQPPGAYLPYCVAKSGLDAMTRCMAEALAPRVQVNGVAPGAIVFPEGTPEAERRQVLERVPAGRTGTPEEVAAVVRFFVTAPDYITGTILPVDGGAALVTG